MTDGTGWLVTPKPHASDAHAFQPSAYRPITQISSDAFAGYSEAIDLSFGPYVQYGQLIKDYRSVELPGRYAPAEMVGSQRRPIYGNVDPGSICTSHVERNNATIRLFLKRFNRLTLCFSKKWENLAAAIALHVAYFNYCWRPRKPGTTGRKRVTPALAAGVTDRLWKLPDLLHAI